MEALSLQAVKADYRPAETQAQGGFGDIFQALLRDSVAQRETLAPPPRADDRPERDTPRRDFSDRRIGGFDGDRRNRPADKDTDYSAYDDVPAAVESHPDPTPAPTEKTVAANTEAQPKTDQSSASDQPPANRDAEKATSASDSNTPTPNGAQKAEEETATTSDNRVSVLDSAQPNTTGSGVAALVAAAGGQASPATVLPVVDGASGKAAAANQTPNPVASPPSAAGTSAPASAGGNGFSAQVTITPAQVVATPNAGLGGGAATAAIAAANASGKALSKIPSQAALATANTVPTTSTAPGIPTVSATSSEAQLLSGTGRQAGIPSNAQIAPTDAQALTNQSVNNAAATVSTLKQEAGLAGSEPRTGATLSSALAETGSARPTQSGQAQGPGGTAPDATGKKLTGQGQGDGTKTSNAQNQQTQSPSQAQTNQATNASIQTGGATAPTQGPQIGEVDTAGGSTGSTDAVSSRAASVSTTATGGFTQALAQSSNTLGSLTHSRGTHPTVANQVAVGIQKAVTAGKDQIRIRLHPAELGQIDVSLKVRHDGTVKAIVTIDRSETFDLMQRDARGLDRALQDAGLKTDSGSLTFNLRGGDQQTPNDGQRGQGMTARSNPETDRMAESPLLETDTPAPFISNRALDIRV